MRLNKVLIKNKRQNNIKKLKRIKTVQKNTNKTENSSDMNRNINQRRRVSTTNYRNKISYLCLNSKYITHSCMIARRSVNKYSAGNLTSYHWLGFSQRYKS